MSDVSQVVTVYFVLTVEVCVAAALSVIWFIYKHIQGQKSKPIQSKSLYYGSIVFFVSVVLYYIVNTMVGTTHWLVLYMSSFTYVTQFGIMVGLLLLRLYIIFKGTPFELTKITVYIFAALYVATFIMGHIAAYSRNFLYDTWWHNTVSIYFFMVIGLVVCFIGLFLYKLISVFRQTAAASSNLKMIAMITRVFLLSTISIFWSLLFAMMTSLHQYLPVTPHMGFWWKALAWTDVYSNFLGILLGFQHFNTLYMKCCRCCDRGCRSMCAGMWLGADASMEMMKMASASVGDTTVTKTTDLTVSQATSTDVTASSAPSSNN